MKSVTLLVLFVLARTVTPVATGVPDGERLGQEEGPPLAPGGYPDHEEVSPIDPGEIKVKTLRTIIPPECRPYASKCPLSTVQVNDQCFRFVNVYMNWTDAKKDCEKQGGYLAIPDFTYNNTGTDLSAVYRTITSTYNIWIGASNMESTVEWKWVDNTILDPDHPNWYPGHSGSHWENCAAIYRMNATKLQIRRQRCDYWGNFLCQFNPSYH